MAVPIIKQAGNTFNNATLSAFVVAAVIHVLIFMLVGTVVVFESPLVTQFFVSEDISAYVAEETEMEPVLLDEPPPLPEMAATETAEISEAGGEAATPSDLIIVSVPAPSTLAFSLPRGIGTPGGLTFGAGPGGEGKGEGGPGRGITASIFGRQIQAKKLGVVLDISDSVVDVIDYAIKEIQSGFPDAILVFAPGCEISTRNAEVVPISGFQNTLTTKYANSPSYTTGPFINKLQRVNPRFKEFWEKSQQSDTCFITFVDISDGKRITLGGIHQSFDFLIHQGVDVIYWFADFRDNIHPHTTDELLKRLRANHIKVMAHDFAPPLGSENRADVTEQITSLTAKTGGEFFLKTASDK